MMIDVYSRERFEEVLAAILPRYESLGIMRGEYCYVLPVDALIGVHVRSSVSQYGYAGESGEDSIRLTMVQRVRCYNEEAHDARARGVCQICHGHGYVWEHWATSKMDSYTTRVAGWEQRLTTKVMFLSHLRQSAGDCPRCHQPKSILQSHTIKNPDRWFASCTFCKAGFKWL